MISPATIDAIHLWRGWADENGLDPDADAISVNRVQRTIQACVRGRWVTLPLLTDPPGSIVNGNFGLMSRLSVRYRGWRAMRRIEGARRWETLRSAQRRRRDSARAWLDARGAFDPKQHDHIRRRTDGGEGFEAVRPRTDWPPRLLPLSKCERCGEHWCRTLHPTSPTSECCI